MSLMSAARRTRRSSPLTARRSGSRFAARTMSTFSTARPSRKRPASSLPNGPGMHDLLARRKVWLRLLFVHPGDGRGLRWRRTSIVGHVPQASPFCPNIAATPDGTQVWFTLKDTGKTQVFDARPPFTLLKTPRYRPDHQPRQYRAQRQRHVRLCDRRWPERSKSLPHERFRASRDDPGRQAAARDLALWRRHARLRWARERRRAHRHRYAHER